MAKSTFKKTILKVTGIGVALGLVIILFMYYANYSEGYRAGVPMKISKKGVVFKTHEGQLNIGGLSNNAEGVIPFNLANSFALNLNFKSILTLLSNVNFHAIVGRIFFI